MKIGGKTVPDEVMRGVPGFLCLYVLIFIACSFLLAAMGVDAVPSAAAVAASIGNIGRDSVRLCFFVLIFSATILWWGQP